MARFYQLLLNEGTIDGRQIFEPKTIAEALRPSLPDPEAAAHPDRIICHPIRWTRGFQLGWGDLAATTALPFGATASRAVFGHNGSNYCTAWADPDHHLVFAHLANLIAPRSAALKHQMDLSDALRNAATSSCTKPHMQ